MEINRCATDAITVVTGYRLGKRTLKFVDYGKLAATFWDLRHHRGVRVVAKDATRQTAAQLYPELSEKGFQQLQAYRDQDLFEVQWVSVGVGSEDLALLPPEPSLVSIDVCAKPIRNFERPLINGALLPLACALAVTFAVTQVVRLFA